MKILIGLKGFVIRLRFFGLALKAIPKFNIGDEVWYCGQKWWISNWSNGPSSSIMRGRHEDGDHQYLEHVSQSIFTKVMSPSNYWHSFSSMYRFYMQSWYSILLYKPLRVTFERPIHGWLYK